jgi:hypothetical protein
LGWQGSYKHGSYFLLETKAIVNVNGIPLLTFQISKGVQQGCPLISYLFILIGEVFNVLVKQAMESKEIKGVMLPIKVNQHVIS